MPLRQAIYPGTFDPLTVGHQDIIERGSFLFDELYVCIAASENKRTLFSLEERTQMIREIIPTLNIGGTVHAISFANLLPDLCRELNIHYVLRGLRAVSDFDYEFQLAAMYRHLDKEIETLFLTPSENHSFISSTMVREVAKLNGNIEHLVHPIVCNYLRRRYTEGQKAC